MKRNTAGKQRFKRLIALITFGTALGYVEETVVYYLHGLLHFHVNYAITKHHTLLNLGFIMFTSPINSLQISQRISDVEIAREAATIIMLITVAYLAGTTRRQRIGAFLVGFACWDILYYVFLKILDNWPSSLFTKDVYFLIPVTWIGPVITPLVISILLLIIGVRLYLPPELSARPKWLHSK